MMTACLWAQESSRSSPFLPADFEKGTEAQPAAGPLERMELRGLLMVDGIYSFSLFDTSIGKGFWVDLHESEQGVTVVNYDEATERVTLEGSGETRSLKLKEAKIIALKVAPPSPGQTTTTATPQGGQSKETISQLSNDQVRDRMKNVAEEIRRRRAARRAIIEKNRAANPQKNQ
jgi:hypothetical protein